MSIYNNINGVWREVSSNTTTDDGNISGSGYSIKIYHNRSLYQTRTVVPNNSILLPTIEGIAGYATDINGISIIYNNGAAITPTSNMNIYSLKETTIKKVVELDSYAGNTSHPDVYSTKIEVIKEQVATWSIVNIGKQETVAINCKSSYGAVVTLNNTPYDYAFSSCPYNEWVSTTINLISNSTVALSTRYCSIGARLKFEYDDVIYTTTW